MRIKAKTAISLLGAGFLAISTMTAAVAADAERKSIAAPEGHPLDEIISGYEFRAPETQNLQDDDFENPAYLWVEKGEELWDTADGKAGKACSSCHEDAAETMKTAGAEFPKWNAKQGKPVNLEQQINLCRTDQMQASKWKWESEELLSMTSFVRSQSRGVPVNVQVDGQMAPFFEKGKDLYYKRVGQLDMACANCHEDNYGTNIRSDMLSQGQSNGFPTFRLKWQKVGSLHRRFKGCMKNIRATPYKVGSDEFVNLELYVGYRGKGLPVEAPAVRN
ncbi:MAG: sulfur oxidation c-type cytochrome SoxA [Sneathiella sp.]